MKTRSRWERLRRKEEDGDAQAGKKEEKWLMRRRKKERKGKWKRKMKMSGPKIILKNKERITKLCNYQNTLKNKYRVLIYISDWLQ